MLQRDLTNNSLSTVHSSPFRRFFWRYRAIRGGCFPERGRDIGALGEEPHEDAFAKDVSTDAPAAVFEPSRFCGGQPVKDGFQGEAFVNEFEVDLFPRVHELDAILEFSFAEAVDIGLFEGLSCVDDACHAVQAVDLERAGGTGFDVSVGTGGDVEIEFREQDAERTGSVRATGLCVDFL